MPDDGNNDYDRFSQEDLRALAHRVHTIAQHLEGLAKQQLNDRYEVRDIRRELADVVEDVALVMGSRLNTDEVRAVRELIMGEERSKWLWMRIRLYAYWIGGVAASIYLLREWIGRVLDFIRIAIR